MAAKRIAPETSFSTVYIGYDSNSTTADQMVSGCFYLLDILEFGGESPLTMRVRCGTFRYCPDPLGIVTAEQLGKLEFI